MSLSLAVKTLSYAYGNTAALSDINFSIAAGECAILLGPNGAGKSTLFSLITHLYDSRSGEISINGFNVKTQACQALANLGVVFQQTTLDMDLSVLQNLYYHASLHGMSRKQASVRVSEELERQGMLARKDEKIRQLNGGHRRRVEIARALLHKPSLLLLDEPTVGLDVSSRKGIVEHVHALCKDDGLSVLWATHLIDEVYPSDKLLVLHQGEIKAQGPVSQVCGGGSADDISRAFKRLTQGISS
ncbi:ABC transporter ATP-binding protein [Cycloclasticus pugetii]|uniref:ABC transporter ATP-binding protein n=1 Tax=Cycloclasticus pugetii TaxID=34068 RepID=UPI00240911F7|nr:ABC transporter ATP-binding protein [Cycloclasticus pugetii]MDF1828794.1 ABC transporter ATP-binding protein [Cycloclasticus pugetii]